MNWIYMTSEVVIFLVLSGAMWLTIKRAQTGQDADGATELAPAHAIAARVNAVDLRALGLDVDRRDQLTAQELVPQ